MIGDRPTLGLTKHKVFKELFILWFSVLLFIRLVVELQRGIGLPEIILAIVPFLFIYGPVWLCNLRKVDSFEYRLFIPAFSDWKAWFSAIKINVYIMAVGIVPWIIGYHLYQTTIFGYYPGKGWPEDLLVTVAYHLFFVAIPEEFFYRGYFQTRLNEVFPRKFLIAGIPFGWGLVIASLFFAFGHSLVTFQWWHFATFFPGLIFGLLREKTGTVITGAFFHAACNITVHILDTYYGII